MVALHLTCTVTAFAPATKVRTTSTLSPFSSTTTTTLFSTNEQAMGAQTSTLLENHRFVVDKLALIDPSLSEIERLRFALQFESLEKATKAVRQRKAWRQGRGRQICDAATKAVQQATIKPDGNWDNEPVNAAAPHGNVINQYMTSKSVLTLSTDEGDLVYTVRASSIDDVLLMDQVSVDQLSDWFLYAKEEHALVANQRSQDTGRLCNVILVNDISGVRKRPDKRFSKALTRSSSQYDVLYPGLAGPTMILNLPAVLQAFVNLIKPLFPKTIQERLLFSKAPLLQSVPDMTTLVSNVALRDEFIQEVKSLLP